MFVCLTCRVSLNVFAKRLEGHDASILRKQRYVSKKDLIFYTLNENVESIYMWVKSSKDRLALFSGSIPLFSYTKKSPEPRC